ncbi:hypothetical protein Y032_0016g3045 [Ancylostoma ceylanicum]|uniref:Uncharacterized protein n=1 Tax=Ancylostoma ceylanicum TaxID=53326 RepID=A0A016V6A4_9BILA|nr:hypothetical protein Y032_0016g3045 [Ancylostoma ceylanicum]
MQIPRVAFAATTAANGWFSNFNWEKWAWFSARVNLTDRLIDKTRTYDDERPWIGGGAGGGVWAYLSLLLLRTTEPPLPALSLSLLIAAD